MSGYTLEDIAALRAVPPNDRSDGHSLLIRKDIVEKPAWYTFIEANQEIDDDNLVLVPNDSPNNGRWLKTNISSGNSSNAASNPSILYVKSSYQEIQLVSQADINFNNLVISTLNSFNGTTFYSPSSGIYRVSVSVDFNTSLNSPDYIFGQIWLSGNLGSESNLYVDTKAFPAAASGQPICLTGTAVLPLRQGNSFACRAFVSTGSNGTGFFYTQNGRLFIEKLPLVYDPPTSSGGAE